MTANDLPMNVKQVEGCAALAKLAHYERGRGCVSRLGGAKLAAAAVSSFANEPAVMEQVC